MMHALVTGAAGFIGFRTARRLLDEGWQVTGIDAFTDYYDVAIKCANADRLIRAGANFVKSELLVCALTDLLDGIDVVYHFAGQPGTRASWGSEFPAYTRMNIDSTQALLEACLRRKDSLQRFVFASSSSVYGDVGALPANEHDLPRPVSPYGVTKLAAEQLCTLYGRNFGLPTVSLRYFTVYGPGQRPDMAFSRFIDSAIRGEPITVFGSGEQVRDCTYIEDVVLANMLAGIRPVSPGTVLNVSGGSDVSINAVLGLVEELAQRPISVINEEAVAGDAQRTAGDTRAIRELLGWRPTVELREGLSRQISSMTVCHARDGG